MAEEVSGAIDDADRARTCGRRRPGRRGPVEFTEALQPHDSIVSPVLRYVHYGVKSGVEDGDWYEEQLQFLLERMLAHHRRVAEQMQRLPALKTATRREIYRRLALAVDLVHASYERDIGLARDGAEPPACRNSTSCGSSPSCTASRRMPTCSASARSRRRGCSRARRSARPGRAAGSGSIRARRWCASCAAGPSTRRRGRSPYRLMVSCPRFRTDARSPPLPAGRRSDRGRRRSAGRCCRCRSCRRRR